MVERFEAEVGDYLGGDLHAVALNSCTAGLYLALKALGIGPGDEVIVPTWTFAATLAVVQWAGARAVLCDVRPENLNIDVEQAKALITPKTRAILPVHMAGYPCDMEPLLEIANFHNLHVIEDAAHAMGTRYKGKKIGSFGQAAVFSFYATKNLACGEGGMLVTRDKALAEKVRRLSYFGIDKTAYRKFPGKDSWYYEIVEPGYKFNMDSIHAALGLAQLERLDQMNARRKQIAAIYRKSLSRVEFFDHRSEHFHCYHLFQVKLPAGLDRDRVIRELRDRNIGSGVHYIPLHLHPCYRKNYPDDAFPAASACDRRTLSLPLFPSLEDEQALAVCEILNHLTGI
jgi:dTDP-4-amino-4,6-dideoxygalactose transaminase